MRSQERPGCDPDQGIQRAREKLAGVLAAIQGSVALGQVCPVVPGGEAAGVGPPLRKEAGGKEGGLDRGVAGGESVSTTWQACGRAPVRVCWLRLGQPRAMPPTKGCCLNKHQRRSMRPPPSTEAPSPGLPHPHPTLRGWARRARTECLQVCCAAPAWDRAS